MLGLAIKPCDHFLLLLANNFELSQQKLNINWMGMKNILN